MVHIRPPVGQGKKLLPNRLNVVQINFRRNDFRFIRRSPGQNPAPGVDNHGIAVSLEIRLDAALGRGNHITFIFQGPGAQQNLPVVPAGVDGKIRRGQKNLGPCHGHEPVNFREPDIITDGKT